jgi:hypothetical protein
MLGTYFYHGHIRRMVTAFGALFNNIYVLRKDAGDQVLSQVRVPLSYAPKRKYLERIAMMVDGEELHDQVAIKLPRMSFEIIGFTYDATRQLSKTNTLRCGTFIDGTSNRIKMYVPVPYNIQFQVNIYSKNQDDALQCIEQIIPFFSPQYTLSVKSLEGISGVTDDVPISLQSLTFSDDYEGAVEQRRTIVYTLDFEMKTFFRGPYDTNGQSVIREVNGIIYNIEGEFMEKVTVKPNPINSLGHPDSDFGFNTEIIRWDSA